MNACLRTGANVLLSWQFVLNLVLILLITCWVPLLSQTMEMRDSNGNLVQQSTRVSRVYESWWVVLKLAPGAKTHVRAVALHLGMCFIITFSVWFIRTYRSHKAENEVPTSIPGVIENGKDTMDDTP